MTAETISLIAGSLLSLAFSYVPGLHPRWEKLQPVTKRLCMAVLLLLVSAGAFALACVTTQNKNSVDWGIGLNELKCTWPGAIGMIKVFILALIANQGTYQITPQPNAIRSWRRDRLNV